MGEADCPLVEAGLWLLPCGLKAVMRLCTRTADCLGVQLTGCSKVPALSASR